MSQDIKKKTKIGMLWNTIEKISVQGISFVLGIILARLLTPDDYGTIGMLTIFLSLANVFVDSGFSRALIQKQDRTEYDFSTVLIFNTVVSFLLYGLLFFASPFIAAFYKTPSLISLQRVLFLVIIFNSLTVVQNSKLQIAVDFKSIAIINAITTIVSGVIAIIFAYKGFGAWALVIQTLSKSIVSLVCFWGIGHWFPKTGFSKDSFKNLFGFGSKLLISGLMAVTENSVNDLIIGKLYKPESLGFYTRAKQFPELTAGTLNSVMTNSTFPMMAALQNDRDELIKTLKKLIKMSSLIVFPAMVGISVLSKQIILVLLGEKWIASSQLLFWLSLSYLFVPLSTLNLNLLNAIGRSDLFLKIDIAKIPIVWSVVAVTFPISLKAVVIGKACVAFVYFYMNAFMLGRLYSFGAIKQLITCWKEIVSTVLMAIIVFIISTILPINVLTLVLEIFIGVIVYSLSLLIFQEQELKFFFNKI
ncbi:lipopolysaccharide biosynthesis protein [uncultured Treponema sp.]|uniref:lipopolysaccharide biosynthesis protein n=1 Tax=uncultured Treponema sp. TaxID=162155 RepID=UPI00280B31CC|nr:lipopolysaccharide biosynthesis protein [uncultured Treponema sp.]